MRQRLYRRAKWVGLALVLLTGIVWASSIPWMWWYITWEDGGMQWEYQVSAQRGSLTYVHNDDYDDAPTTTFAFHVAQNRLPPIWWPVLMKGSTGRIIACALPLWILFLLASIPTSYLWWIDRRRPEGHCDTCGYNLTGNVSGTCPECGEKA